MTTPLTSDELAQLAAAQSAMQHIQSNPGMTESAKKEAIAIIQSQSIDPITQKRADALEEIVATQSAEKNAQGRAAVKSEIAVNHEEWVKAKISEKDESEVLTESTTILDPDGNPVG